MRGANCPRIGARGVADHALVFGELLVEQEWIVPLETPPSAGLSLV